MKSALAKWESSSRCGENHRYRARNRSRRGRRGGRRRSCAGHLERQADGVPRAAPSQLPAVLRRPADLADRHLDADGRAVVAGAEALEFAVDARHRLVRGLHADRAGRAVRGRGGRSRRSPAPDHRRADAIDDQRVRARDTDVGRRGEGRIRDRPRRAQRLRELVRHAGAPGVRGRDGGARRPAQRDRDELDDLQRRAHGRAGDRGTVRSR